MVFKTISKHLSMIISIKISHEGLIVVDSCGNRVLPWRGLEWCAPKILLDWNPTPSLGNSTHPPFHECWLEPVEAKRILCGGVSKDHVWVVEHVQAVKRQRVNFQIIQRELGVDIKADVCGQRACKILGQAGRRLSTHWAERNKACKKRLDLKAAGGWCLSLWGFKRKTISLLLVRNQR